MDKIDTSLDFINFVNDVTKLRHIELEKINRSTINLDQGSNVEELVDEDNIEVKEVENKKHRLEKPFEKELKDLWLHHDDDKQIPYPIYDYWDKNHWIHPDLRTHRSKPVIIRKSRRIREHVERRPYDAVAYVDKEDHHCHRYDSPKKTSDCYCGIGIKLISSAQVNCTVEKPHIHYTNYERIYHPAKTVHEYDEQITEEQNEQHVIYDFVDGFYHKVSTPRGLGVEEEL